MGFVLSIVLVSLCCPLLRKLYLVNTKIKLAEIDHLALWSDFLDFPVRSKLNCQFLKLQWDTVWTKQQLFGSAERDGLSPDQTRSELFESLKVCLAIAQTFGANEASHSQLNR